MTFVDVVESSLDDLQAHQERDHSPEHQNGLLTPLDQVELAKGYDGTRRFSCRRVKSTFEVTISPMTFGRDMMSLSPNILY